MNPGRAADRCTTLCLARHGTSYAYGVMRNYDARPAPSPGWKDVLDAPGTAAHTQHPVIRHTRGASHRSADSAVPSNKVQNRSSKTAPRG